MRLRTSGNNNLSEGAITFALINTCNSAKMTAHWNLLLIATFGTLPLGYGSYLLVNELQVRASMTAPGELTAAPTPTTKRLHEFNPSAIATVMGLATSDAAVRSAEPLTLRASFVSNTGLSRALLTSTDSERLYQEGDTLPGGSVLRRVEISQVVLWRNGREELLALQSTTERHALKLNPENTMPSPSLIHVHLQPSAE